MNPEYRPVLNPHRLNLQNPLSYHLNPMDPVLPYQFHPQNHHPTQ